MSIQENQSLIHQYVDQFVNCGDMEIADELLSPDYRRYISPSTPPLTVDQQKQRIAGLRAAFPDLNVTIEDVVTEGNRLAFRGVFRGTHQGEFLGIKPTGKQVTVFAFDVVNIDNGKLIEHWGGPDIFGILSQLGGVVSSGQEKK